MKYQISLDIGATKILGGIVSKNKTVYKIKKPTQSQSGKVKILKNIKNIIDELNVWALSQNKYSKLEKIGIGLAGQIDTKNGIILSTTNFSNDFKNIKLSEILNKNFGVGRRTEFTKRGWINFWNRNWWSNYNEWKIVDR